MDTYTLIKDKKGSKYLYTIIAPDGREVKRRLSAHNYVAATCEGKYFFSRRNLIGKGSHGYYINDYKDALAYLLSVRAKSEAPHRRTHHHSLPNAMRSKRIVLCEGEEAARILLLRFRLSQVRTIH